MGEGDGTRRPPDGSRPDADADADRRADAGAADGHVGDAPPPGTAEGVAHHHRHVDVEPGLQSIPDPPRRAVAVDREQGRLSPVAGLRLDLEQREHPVRDPPVLQLAQLPERPVAVGRTLAAQGREEHLEAIARLDEDLGLRRAGGRPGRALRPSRRRSRPA